MRRAALIAVLAALLAIGAASAQAQTPSLPDIEDEVMCVECGTALNVSQSAAADGERRFIERRIAEGMSKEQIKQALVAEYGRNVLGNPENKGFARAVYLVPIGLALLAAAAIVLTAKRWRRAGEIREEARTEEPLTDADAKRLERDMAGYDL